MTDKEERRMIKWEEYRKGGRQIELWESLPLAPVHTDEDWRPICYDYDFCTNPDCPKLNGCHWLAKEHPTTAPKDEVPDWEKPTEEEWEAYRKVMGYPKERAKK
jgi:hypothetical protein